MTEKKPAKPPVGALGIDDVEVEHRIDLDRNVFMRDYILARNLDDLNAQVDPDHFLEERDQQDQARPFNALETSKAKDHGSFVLTEDPHTRSDQDEGREQYCWQDEH